MADSNYGIINTSEIKPIMVVSFSEMKEINIANRDEKLKTEVSRLWLLKFQLMS